MAKNLILYYSRKGENYWGGRIKMLPKGNTEIVAEKIQETVGGDLFEVETVKPYAADYTACTVQAKEELQADARPELKRYLSDVNGYDTIFVGYPNWWGTMPMAMFSLLERLDLTGKRVVPFCTNEGSGMGNSARDLKKLCPGAVIEKGLAIRGCEAESSADRVADWARKAVQK